MEQLKLIRYKINKHLVWMSSGGGKCSGGWFGQRVNSSACGVMDELRKDHWRGIWSCVLCRCTLSNLKKALWVLRYLDDPRSTLQPCPRMSLRSKFGFSKSLRTGRVLLRSMLAACYSTAEGFGLWRTTSQCPMAFKMSAETPTDQLISSTTVLTLNQKPPLEM